MVNAIADMRDVFSVLEFALYFFGHVALVPQLVLFSLIVWRSCCPGSDCTYCYFDVMDTLATCVHLQTWTYPFVGSFREPFSSRSVP